MGIAVAGSFLNKLAEFRYTFLEIALLLVRQGEVVTTFHESRAQLQSLLILVDGLINLAELHQRDTQLIVRFHVVGPVSDSFTESVDGARVVLLVKPYASQVVVGRGVVGPRDERGLELSKRCLQVTLRAVRNSQRVMSIGIVAMHFQGFS